MMRGSRRAKSLHELRLLTTDADFARIAETEPLERWMP
jgi:hypothetical protein